MTDFETLFRDHYTALYKLALKLSGSHENAEDIVQQAYLNAYNNRGHFRGASTPYTWLYKITLNCSYRYIKKLKKLPVQVIAHNQGISEQAVFASLPACNDSVDQLIVAEMRERCLSGFMRCLPAKQRVAFTLREILNLSLNEAASIMETSENNVKVLTYRARKYMQGLMENRCSFLRPDNPCKCEIWIGFALERGLIKKEDASKLKHQTNETIIFEEEVGVLHKIRVLHKLSKPSLDSSEFINEVTRLIKEKKLTILS